MHRKGGVTGLWHLSDNQINANATGTGYNFEEKKFCLK